MSTTNYEQSAGYIGQLEKQVTARGEASTPDVLVVTCTDANLNFYAEAVARYGSMLLLRSPGSQLRATESGDNRPIDAVMWAIERLRVRHLVLCGHSQCSVSRARGADGKLASAVAHDPFTGVFDTTTHEQQQMLREKQHLRHQLQHLVLDSPLAPYVAKAELQVHGMFYLHQSGVFLKCEPLTGEFRLLVQDP